jgi:hypothetical protein
MLEHLQYGIDKYSSTISFFFHEKQFTQCIQSYTGA